MTVTPLKVTMLGELPSEESWSIWAKKIDGEWSVDSPSIVAPFVLDNDFHNIGECWNINQLKAKYQSNGYSIEQFTVNFVASLNTATDVDWKTFEETRKQK